MTVCNVTFTPTVDLVAPKLYYRIENFFANHRNFVKSRNFKHLRGATTEGDAGQIETSCTPAVYHRDMGLNNNYTALNGGILNPDGIALPCGLIAKYHFNDTYKIYQGNDSSNGSSIFINEKGIALDADVTHKFHT